MFSGSGSLRERSGLDVDAGMAEPGPSYWRGPPHVDAPPFSTLTSAAARLNDMDAARAHGINKRRYDDESDYDDRERERERDRPRKVEIDDGR